MVSDDESYPWFGMLVILAGCFVAGWAVVMGGFVLISWLFKLVIGG